MAVSRSPSHRFAIFLILGALCLVVFYISTSSSSLPGAAQQSTTKAGIQDNLQLDLNQPGRVISAKLGNETVKAELGRASWKLFHTMMAQFPDSPTAEEQAALRSYIHLFQRLYPCGECAEHFGSILEDFPPQVSSRNVAAGWACHVHNKVNEGLGKDVFDCANIGEFYDCGCSGDGEDGQESPARKGDHMLERNDAEVQDITAVKTRAIGLEEMSLMLDSIT